VETELSETLLRAGDVEAAIVAANEAVESFKSLGASHDARRFRRDLAVAYDRLGTAQAQKRHIDAAQKAYFDGIQVLSNDGPDAGDEATQLTKAILLQRLGDLRGREEDWAAARQLFSESLALKKTILNKTKSSPEYRRQFAESLRKLAEAKLRTEDAIGAIVALREVTELLEELYKESPSASVTRDTAETYLLLADAFGRANKLKEVDAPLLAAMQAANLYFTQRPSCQSYQQLIDATNSVALNLMIRRSEVSLALDMFRKTPTFDACRPSAIDAGGLRLSLGMRQALETLALELTSTGDGAQFWNSIPTLVAKLKPTIDATNQVARWEDFSVRLAVFGAKSAQRVGAYGDAARTVGRVLDEIDKPKCSTRSECRRIALALGQLSWSALLAGDFALALKSSADAIDLVGSNNLPSMSFVELNHAHALLFSGVQSDAARLYDKFTRKEVADDFRELKKAGHCHDLMVQFDPALLCNEQRTAN
jgi:tetratricopeptide (TPR) repeat protein